MDSKTQHLWNNCNSSYSNFEPISFIFPFGEYNRECNFLKKINKLGQYFTKYQNKKFPPNSIQFSTYLTLLKIPIGIAEQICNFTTHISKKFTTNGWVNVSSFCKSRRINLLFRIYGFLWKKKNTKINYPACVI